MASRLGWLSLLLGSGALIASAPAYAAVEVIFSQVSGHSTALMPPGAGLTPGTEFKVQTTSGFDRPFPSPDGTKFFVTGLANLATSEDECYIVWDNGTATTVAREGTAFGSPTGDLIALGDQRMGINNAGQFVFGVDTNAATTADKFVIKWDGSTFVVVAREGDPVPGVATELWGNNLNSGHILADGTAAFCGTDTNGALPTTEDDFAMVGSTILIQTGNAIEAAFWDAMNVSDFWVTPDGLHWMLVGDDTSATTQDRILAVDGVVQAREGVPLIGSSYTENVSSLFGGTESILSADGSYLLRGHNVDGEDWVLRNGVVIASTDDPITSGNAELFDDAIFANCFFSIAGNSVGDWVIGGVTNAVNVNANAVLVLNGERVVAREGDRIDLNGNGMPDDDAFISIFNDDDCFLTDDLQLVFLANCVNAKGVSIGQMVLRLDLSVAPCPADIDDDGQVAVTDLLSVINNWGGGIGNAADLNGDGTVDVQDLLAVINAWGACP